MLQGRKTITNKNMMCKKLCEYKGFYTTYLLSTMRCHTIWLYILYLFSIKVRFHLCIMWMQTMNVNAIKENRAHRISTGVIPFVRMWMRTANAIKWIAACSDQCECKCFIRRETTSYTGWPQSSTCHVEGKLHWSPNRICHSHSSVTFGLHTSGILASNLCRRVM